MRVSVTTKYRSGEEKIMYFGGAVEAAKYGEYKAKNLPQGVVSIVLKGPEGEREFIK